MSLWACYWFELKWLKPIGCCFGLAFVWLPFANGLTHYISWFRFLVKTQFGLVLERPLLVQFEANGLPGLHLFWVVIVIVVYLCSKSVLIPERGSNQNRLTELMQTAMFQEMLILCPNKHLCSLSFVLLFHDKAYDISHPIPLWRSFTRTPLSERRSMHAGRAHSFPAHMLMTSSKKKVQDI